MKPTIYQWTENAFEQAELKIQYSGVLQRFDKCNLLIGLCFEKSARLAFLMENVRQSGNAFCWLDPQASVSFIKNRCMKMRVKILLSDKKLEWPSTSWTFDDSTQVWINELPFADNLDVFGSQFVYSICTSGTTGQAKCVLVPPEAINPNVQDFIERFGLDRNSKLMWSTSLDFDPSFLELLMAFELNCSFYIVNDVDLKRVWRFAAMIKKVRPSFLQITPAVLSLFSSQFLFELFGSDSPVAHLLIGGDTFPVAFIKRYARNCSAKIYNVYGLTEVSCWASCTRFDPEIDQFADASNSILDTHLRFSSNGVEIHGRGCVVNGEKRQSTQTGDQFIMIEDGGKTKYVITSREKINGTVVSREVEDYLLATFNYVEAARLITFNEQLFIFVKKTGFDDDLPEIPQKFGIKEIFCVEQFPITVNGKINDSELRKHIQQNIQLRSIKGTVFDYLRENPELRQSNTTIASLGFGSRDLFEFIFEIEQRKKIEDDELKTIRQCLFDERTPVSYLFELLSQCQNKEENTPDGHIELHKVNGSISAKLRQRFQMKKCVDYSANFCTTMLFVGDMSGFFAIFDSQTEKTVFEKKHNAAVISKPLIMPESVVYCTVDGYAHWVNLSSFEAKSANVGESIRSDPCLFDKTRILVAAFSSHLVLLDLKSGEFEQVCEFNAGLIRNAPLICVDFVIASTIDGSIGGYCKNELTKLVWRRDLKKSLFVPLFGLPIADQFGVLTLDGCLYFMVVQSGEISRQFDFHASACSIQPTILDESKFIVIPCAKDSIRLINFQELYSGNEGADPKLYRLPGFNIQSRLIYSKKFGKFLVKCNTTEDASCKLLSLDFAKHEFDIVLELDAPSFGDPLVIPLEDAERLVVGARDNFVYVFDVTG